MLRSMQSLVHDVSSGVITRRVYTSDPTFLHVSLKNDDMNSEPLFVTSVALKP
jgi:hypothetical protein